MDHIATLQGNFVPLPAFFPDATRATVRTLDMVDITNTKTPGLLVNTYHLTRDLAGVSIKDGIREFMGWSGAVISDSGGFQIMSIAKRGNGKVTDEGVIFHPSRSKRVIFTPEESIEFQIKLKSDIVVVLDDFTPPDANYHSAKNTVDRTILWAVRCKKTFIKLTDNMINKPLLIAVVQGGKYQDLRAQCAQQLVNIGFDGYGYGGWPMSDNGTFDIESARTIQANTPPETLLYGLGVGKPEDIVACVALGFNIFDCVLPTRDARHGRLYVFNADTINAIDITKQDFYSCSVANKQSSLANSTRVSRACDCLLCTHYSSGYLAHLFKIKDASAHRLATIHNLRFYSLLMENLRRRQAK